MSQGTVVVDGCVAVSVRADESWQDAVRSVVSMRLAQGDTIAQEGRVTDQRGKVLGTYAWRSLPDRRWDVRVMARAVGQP